MNKKISSFFVLFLVADILGNLSFGSAVYAINSTNFKEILIKKYNKNDLEVVRVAENDFDQKIKEIRLQKDVQFADLNGAFEATIIPSDPYFDKQWYLKRIKAPEAWDEQWDASSIVVAVVDSGVQIDHPDLKDNIWVNAGEIPNNGIDDDNNGFVDDYNGWDFYEDNSDPNPKYEEGYTKDGIMHGTVVAGVMAAGGNNFLGVTGVAWNAKIMPLRVLNGKGEGSTMGVVRAIDYAIKNGADVINFSFVGSGYSQILEDAIRRAYNAGVIVVAAAGNDVGANGSHFLDNEPLYPVCYDGEVGENMVIGVAATDPLDQKADFSGYGKNCIDVSAPGISIYSTAVKKADSNVFNNYYDGYWAGTSMAVPMVSGAIALIEAKNPRLSRKGVVDVLLKNTDNIDGLNPNYIGELGTGRLNLYKSISNATNGDEKKNVNLVIAPFSGKNGEILLTSGTGVVLKKFFAFDKNFKGGVNVASGDVDGDGLAEIIVSAGIGSGPQIKIFKNDGKLSGQFFAFDKNFKGGVSVTSGDVDGDGLAEIIAGAGVGGVPQVRIFSSKGKLKKQFLVFDKNFKGGINVAGGDVDGDGLSEVIVGAGVGGGPQVRIFKNNGQLSGQFFAYDKKFRGGVNVAVGAFENKVRNAGSMIITSPGKGGGPQVRIFDNHFKIHGQFFAYAEQFRGGVNITMADIDNDGRREIITGTGPGGAPHVRTFRDDGTLVTSFYAYSESFSGGVSVSAIEF